MRFEKRATAGSQRLPTDQSGRTGSICRQWFHDGALIVGTQDASLTGGLGTVATTMFTDVSQRQLVTN